MDAQQLEFARRHGITRCPPTPEVRMSWRLTGTQHASRAASEDELMINPELLLLLPTPRFVANRAQAPRRPR